MAQTPATICGTGADDATVGSITWSNPTRIQADDGSYATAALVLVNDQSHYIKGSNFGFAIPTGATILGVFFEFKLSQAIFGGTNVDVSAKIGKGGTIGGSEQASSANTLTTVDTWYGYGGSSNLCGLTLTATEVNASDFLAVISIKQTFTPASTINCDACRVTVYYTDPAAMGHVIIAQREVHWSEIYE